jgi:hypothetical protein
LEEQRGESRFEEKDVDGFRAGWRAPLDADGRSQFFFWGSSIGVWSLTTKSTHTIIMTTPFCRFFA